MSKMKEKMIDMINRMNPKEIPRPSYQQAFIHLLQTVAHADKQGVKSVTIEAIRVVTETLQAPDKDLPS